MNKSVIWTSVEEMTPPMVRARSFGSVAAQSPRITLQRRGAPKSIRSYYINLIAALNQCESGTVWICEHDVLYPPDWFDESLIESPITYAAHGYYLTNRGYTNRNGAPMSTLAGDVDTIRRALTDKLKEHFAGGRVKWTEPGIKDGYKTMRTLRKNVTPYIDVRHGGNFTGARNGGKPRDAVEPWGCYKELWESMGVDNV